MSHGIISVLDADPKLEDLLREELRGESVLWRGAPRPWSIGGALRSGEWILLALYAPLEFFWLALAWQASHSHNRPGFFLLMAGLTLVLVFETWRYHTRRWRGYCYVVTTRRALILQMSARPRIRSFEASRLSFIYQDPDEYGGGGNLIFHSRPVPRRRFFFFFFRRRRLRRPGFYHLATLDAPAAALEEMLRCQRSLTGGR